MGQRCALQKFTGQWKVRWPAAKVPGAIAEVHWPMESQKIPGHAQKCPEQRKSATTVRRPLRKSALQPRLNSAGNPTPNRRASRSALMHVIGRNVGGGERERTWRTLTPRSRFLCHVSSAGRKAEDELGTAATAQPPASDDTEHYYGLHQPACPAPEVVHSVHSKPAVSASTLDMLPHLPTALHSLALRPASDDALREARKHRLLLARPALRPESCSRPPQMVRDDFNPGCLGVRVHLGCIFAAWSTRLPA